MRAKILTLGLICSLLLGSVLSAEKKDPINFWHRLFTEPIEIVYIIMKDERVFHRTGHNEIQVSMDTGRLKAALKKKGYEIKDIAVIIHNHLKDYRFSSDDHQRYRRLKKYGFEGFFLLYCQGTGKVYNIEDGKKSN